MFANALTIRGCRFLPLLKAVPAVYLQATGRTLMDAELALAGQRDLKQEKRQSMR